VPRPVQALARADSLGRYTVKKGDTLWGIALDHAVSLEELLRINNLSRNTILRPGQELQIPASSS
jgi:LysM repeat protein